MIRILAAVSLILPLSAISAEVISIADGDTLTILDDRKQIKIRLANIDAPEKKQAFGQRSRESLSELCFRKNATYETQTIDKYGRTVAVITCDGIEANRAQVERGMAWVYTKYNKDASLPAMQEAAKSDESGLWRDPDPIPPWEWRRR